jgi:hypothetical protein
MLPVQPEPPGIIFMTGYRARLRAFHYRNSDHRPANAGLFFSSDDQGWNPIQTSGWVMPKRWERPDEDRSRQQPRTGQQQRRRHDATIEKPMAIGGSVRLSWSWRE